MNDTERCYSLADIASLTFITDRTLRKCINNGVLVGQKCNGKWEFSFDELMKFISSKDIAIAAQKRQKSVLSEALFAARTKAMTKFEAYKFTDFSEELMCEIIDFSLKARDEYGITTCLAFVKNAPCIAYFGELASVEKATRRLLEIPYLRRFVK